MVFKVSISSIFECSLERAFKSPMLCDIAKVHTGFLLMPKVTHTSEDADWGKVGSSKKVFAAKSITQKGGFTSMDRVLERRENEYWKIQVDSFQTFILGFKKFVGEWKTTESAENKILVEYTYHMHAGNIIFYPLNWIFARIFWKIYMKRVLENVRKLAYEDAPYLHD
jgi:hypothetical protein